MIIAGVALLLISVAIGFGLCWWVCGRKEALYMLAVTVLVACLFGGIALINTGIEAHENTRNAVRSDDSEVRP